ncbi:MAG: glycosyl transferase [Acidimicrobiaceae bacterium]|nr:glycosyl transferase [Acidimicrobiaceae bacterium]
MTSTPFSPTTRRRVQGTQANSATDSTGLASVGSPDPSSTSVEHEFSLLAPAPDVSEDRSERLAPAGGMHASYQVPDRLSPPSRYVAVGWKFAIAVVTAALWTGASAWISAPWVTGLAAHVTILPAILIVSLLAFLPGFVVAFLMVGLAFDRQPPLRVTSPREPVTILIAARNEEAAIGDTMRSLAQQDYEGPLRVIVIDNGSTDNTREVALAAAGEAGFAIEILTETTPGKSHALNLGLANVTSSLVITVDADTLLQRSAVRLLVSRLMSSPPAVHAVAGAVMVRNSRSTFWSRLQAWDYFLGIASVKRMQGLFQNTLVAQGAFSLYRSDAVRDAGGWPDAIGEDIVLTWKMMNNGANVFFEPLAVAFTSAPESLKVLALQRSRWARGMIEGLRTVPPWRHQNGYAKVLTGFNLLIPFLDIAYVFLWLPGVVLACFGIFWFVGPMTVAVLPMTLLVYGILFHYQNRRVFRPLGLRVRRNLVGLLLFVIIYQIFMSSFSVIGYAQELTRRTRRWK